MSKRTYNPVVLLSATNFSAPQIQQISKGLDFPDSAWLTYDGAGNAEAWAVFLQPFTPPATGAGKQRIRVRIRKSAPGGNNVVVDFNLRQNNILLATLQADVTISSDVEETHVFLWDAALLDTAAGFGIGLQIDQSTGGTGPAANRRGFDVSAIDFTYEDDIGSSRLVRTRVCDGACCIAAPRFPIGDGVIIPHQGSDCLHRTAPDGKEIGGCALFEDEALRPGAGIKTILKNMENVDALQLFIDTCLSWPQNTPPGDTTLGPCCWTWEDDI